MHYIFKTPNVLLSLQRRKVPAHIYMLQCIAEQNTHLQRLDLNTVLHCLQNFPVHSHPSMNQPTVNVTT